MLRILGARVVTAIAMFACAALAHAQPAADATERSERLIDWYFATTFGTGIYQVGERTVTVVRLPFQWQYREASENAWGVRLRVPLTVGFQNVQNAVDEIFNRTYGTVAVLPGVEFERRLTPYWRILPTVSYGYARDVSNGNGSQIYEVGTRSEYYIPRFSGDFYINNALLLAGNFASGDVGQRLGILQTGLTYVIPTGKGFFGSTANIGLHVNHYLYFREIDFFLDSATRRGTNNQFEVGVSLGTYEPLNMFGFKFDRIGLGFRVSSDLIALRLITSLMF